MYNWITSMGDKVKVLVISDRFRSICPLNQPSNALSVASSIWVALAERKVTIYMQKKLDYSNLSFINSR